MTLRDRSTPLRVVAIGVFPIGGGAFASIAGLSLLLPNSFLSPVWRLNESSLTQFESMGAIYSAALLLGVALSTSLAGVAK